MRLLLACVQTAMDTANARLRKNGLPAVRVAVEMMADGNVAEDNEAHQPTSKRARQQKAKQRSKKSAARRGR